MGLAEAGEAHEEEGQAGALLPRQRLRQVDPEAGETLEGGVADVELEEWEELVPEVDALGDDEGVRAVGFGQHPVVLEEVSM